MEHRDDERCEQESAHPPRTAWRARSDRELIVAMRADISAALARAGSLRDALAGCCETFVRRLGVSFAGHEPGSLSAIAQMASTAFCSSCTGRSGAR